MLFRSLRSTIAAAVFVASPAAAGDPLSATGSAWGIGLEVSAVDQSLEVELNGVAVAEGSVDEIFHGVYAYLQRGPQFRAEARVLTANVDGDGDTDSVTHFGAQGTAGYAVGPDTRLYAGIGIEHVSGARDSKSQSVYLPLGVAKSGDLQGGWRALTTLEFQMLLAGIDEVDIPGGGDVEFDRNGGWGAEVSVQFHHSAGGIGVEPFIHWAAPGDSDSENVGGTEVRIVDVDSQTTGVRVLWQF